MNPQNGIPWTHNQFENSPKKAKIKSMDGESRGDKGASKASWGFDEQGVREGILPWVCC